MKKILMIICCAFAVLSASAQDKKLTLNAEMISPFPGAGNDRTLRIYTFVDAGNVYGEDEKFEFSQLRASVGVGLSWISPLGPLRLGFGQHFLLHSPQRKNRQGVARPSLRELIPAKAG